MEYIKTFAFAAIFIFLSIVCVINLINGRKEEKAAKEERKRRRSPFAGQKQMERAEQLERPEPSNNPNKPEPSDNPNQPE